MPACVFMGSTKEEDTHYGMFENICDLFKYLIEKEDVKLFYSTAKSGFDSLCETAVDFLKGKYKDIELVKIAGKDDRKHREDITYDRIINFENNNYKKRCIYAAHISDFIFFDKYLSDDGLIDRFVIEIAALKHFIDGEIRSFSLKQLMNEEEL